MPFKLNGSDITSDWVVTSVSQGGTTGFQESGTDLAQKYAKCGNASCGTNYTPVCQSIPSEFNPASSYTFWTGSCTYTGVIQ